MAEQEVKDRAFFEFDGPVIVSPIELPFENRVVAANGICGKLQIKTSDGVCYSGKPVHEVKAYAGDLLSIEKLGHNFYYVIKAPLKGGYWRPKSKAFYEE